MQDHGFQVNCMNSPFKKTEIIEFDEPSNYFCNELIFQLASKSLNDALMILMIFLDLLSEFIRLAGIFDKLTHPGKAIAALPRFLKQTWPLKKNTSRDGHLLLYFF